MTDADERKLIKKLDETISPYHEWQSELSNAVYSRPTASDKSLLNVIQRTVERARLCADPLYEILPSWQLLVLRAKNGDQQAGTLTEIVRMKKRVENVVGPHHPVYREFDELEQEIRQGIKDKSHN